MLFDENFKEIFSTEIVCLIVGLIGGTALAIYTDQVLLIPGMLILLPGFLEMKNNISGSLAARIGSGLFVGAIKPGHTGKKILKANIFASFLLAISMSVLLGTIAFLATYLIFHQAVYSLFIIAVTAGMLTNLIEIPVAVLATIYFYKEGFDPDNIMGSFITSLGDIIGIFVLLGVILLI